MLPTIQLSALITSTLSTFGSHSTSTVTIRHESSSRTVVQQPWSLKRGLALALIMYTAGASTAAPLGQHPLIQHAPPGSSVIPSSVPQYTYLATMNPFYIGEDKRPEKDKRIEYLDENARKDFEIDIKNGKLYKRDGQAFDSAMNAPSCTVLSPDHKLYAKDACKVFEFHHSSFLSGNPVAWAGDIVVDQGNLLFMDRHSGHYNKETPKHLHQAIEHVKERGVDNEFVVDEQNGWDHPRTKLREVMEERNRRHQEP